MADFELVRGSTQRSITTVLTDSNSTDDMSTAQSGQIFMRGVGATSNKIDGAALTTVTASISAITATYAPVATDVILAGDFLIYFVITYSSGKTDRFPSNEAEFHTVHIVESFE